MDLPDGKGDARIEMEDARKLRQLLELRALVDDLIEEGLLERKPLADVMRSMLPRICDLVGARGAFVQSYDEDLKLAVFRTPADLSQHRFALFNEPPLLDEWVLERGGKRARVRLKPRLVTNAGEAHVAAVCEGAALGLIPSFLLPHDYAKQLEPVLPEWSLGHRGIFAVYPHRRFVTAKVRAFVDFCREALGDGARDPWWPA